MYFIVTNLYRVYTFLYEFIKHQLVIRTWRRWFDFFSKFSKFFICKISFSFTRITYKYFIFKIQKFDYNHKSSDALKFKLIKMLM